MLNLIPLPTVTRLPPLDLRMRPCSYYHDREIGLAHQPLCTSTAAEAGGPSAGLVNLYPNPAENTIIIESSVAISGLAITILTGGTIFRSEGYR